MLCMMSMSTYVSYGHNLDNCALCQLMSMRVWVPASLGLIAAADLLAHEYGKEDMKVERHGLPYVLKISLPASMGEAATICKHTLTVISHKSLLQH